MGMSEGLREGLSLAIMAETVVMGFPDKNSFGEYTRQSGSFRLHLFTDSEAGQHIAAIKGLQRKVRHMELRVAFLQEQVDSQRLTVHFVAGKNKPADILTKYGDVHHAQLFASAAGCCSLEGEKGGLWTDDVLGCIARLETDVRRKSEESVQCFGEACGQKDTFRQTETFVEVCHVRPRRVLCLPAAAAISHDHEFALSGDRLTSVDRERGSFRVRDNYMHADEPMSDLGLWWVGKTWFFKMQNHTTRRICLAHEPKKVKFQFDEKSEPEGELGQQVQAFRSLPKSWESFVSRHENLDSWRQPLVEICRGSRHVFIEICCQEESLKIALHACV